jgi:hypothetical protein
MIFDPFFLVYLLAVSTLLEGGLFLKLVPPYTFVLVVSPVVTDPF